MKLLAAHRLHSFKRSPLECLHATFPAVRTSGRFSNAAGADARRTSVLPRAPLPPTVVPHISDPLRCRAHPHLKRLAVVPGVHFKVDSEDDPHPLRVTATGAIGVALIDYRCELLSDLVPVLAAVL
ncbi:hypothetical protein SCP_0601510 [Sparassis crispa]|uniref:Uncharacterized protein n=1 Tax=Sparassis crispa TaxID=139825 RepID=A0A401GPM5_9APHY|nr:hypothetical protein SCP_0601510 [Sparassis crispa]GBE84173.1 hypothetical protein SCP_0601510 [Sparassis crispa]